AAVADLALLRDVAPEDVDVLVVHLRDLLLAEVAALAPPGGGAGAGALAGACLLCHSLLLERDVVVGGRGREVGGGPDLGRDVLASLRVAAAVEELDGLRDHLDLGALAAVLGLPRRPVEAAV